MLCPFVLFQFCPLGPGSYTLKNEMVVQPTLKTTFSGPSQSFVRPQFKHLLVFKIPFSPNPPSQNWAEFSSIPSNWAKDEITSLCFVKKSSSQDWFHRTLYSARRNLGWARNASHPPLESVRRNFKMGNGKWGTLSKDQRGKGRERGKGKIEKHKRKGKGRTRGREK